MSGNSKSGARQKVDSRDRSKSVRRALGFALILHLVWIAAWILERTLETQTDFVDTRASRFVYWNSAKLLLWVLPAIVLIRASGQTFCGVMAFDRVRAILA